MPQSLVSDETGEEFFAVKDLSIRFGGVAAFEDVSFSVRSGELYGIIGPNGAGKTTLLNCISGVLRPQQGSVHLRGRPLLRSRAHAIADMGVARTFQTLENFGNFTVVDFVMLGRIRWRPRAFVSCGLALPSVARREREARHEVMAILDRFGLADIAGMAVNELPYGTQKMIDVMRALASEPQLLLLDEPTSGSSQAEREVLRELMDELRASRTTVLVVDHDVGFISSCCDQVMAMAFGRQLVNGSASEVLAHDEVIAAYLGGSTDSERDGAETSGALVAEGP